ncbi:interleukin-like EMT inducer domain-containing protein [Methyloferula stellata]|uniref:interleukin-like EMT inducer domain-containing protein n=1 Tax=Methyloferula stellata TaxID=876270 RepID=UPI0003A7BC0B|nr:interleukin-like EMT inducer domain-containing protein [Methyloferula stellata]
MPTFEIDISSAGPNFGNSALIKGWGTIIPMPGGSYGRGLNVAILSEINASILKTAVFDTGGDPGAGDAFATLVEQTPVGQYVLVAAKGDAATNLTDRAKRACRMIGSGLIGNLTNLGSWAIIGQRGAAPGAAMEQQSNLAAVHLVKDVPALTDNANGVEIAALSGGWNGGNQASITMRGAAIAIAGGGYRRGLNVAVMDGTTAAVLATYNFDTYLQGPADQFAALIEGLPAGRMVAVTVLDDAFTQLTERAKLACESLGSAQIRKLGFRSSWSMIGFKDALRGSVAETISGNSPVTSVYWHFPETTDSRVGISLALASAGTSFGAAANLTVGGFALAALAENATFGRGLNVSVIGQGIDPMAKIQTFDTGGSSSAADAFADMIEQLPLGELVAIAVADDAFANLSERAKRACELIGSGLIRNLALHGSWAILGRKGCAPGSVPEVLRNDGAVGLEAWFARDQSRLARLFMEVQVDSAGNSVGNRASISISPNLSKLPLASVNSRGLNVVVIDETTGQATFTRSYDTCGSSAEADAFAAMVEALPTGRIVAIAVCDEAQNNLTERAKRACESLGSRQIRNLQYRGSWAIIGKKGAQSTSVPEALSNNSPASARYWLFPDSLFSGRGFNIAALAGGSSSNPSWITVKGTAVAGLPGAGLNFAIIDQTNGNLLQQGYVTPAQSSAQADAFAMIIEQLPRGRIVAVATMGDAATGLTERAKLACETLGSGFIRALRPNSTWAGLNSSWVMIGVKGLAPGSALEQVRVNGSASLSTWFPFPPAHVEANPAVAVAVVVFAIMVLWYMDWGATPAQPAQLPVYVPPKLRRYNEFTFLTAHNAMANVTDGWNSLAAQQQGSVTEQLAQGVRAFALDVFVYSPTTGGTNDLYLCHGYCGSPGMPSPPRLLSATLTEIVTFLNANSNDIVTILFESQSDTLPDAASNALFVAAFATSNATDLIFWPDSTSANPPSGARTWDVNLNVGQFNWPTVDQMKTDNKRLVMFVDRDKGSPQSLRHVVPFVWRYMRENWYSDQDWFNFFSPDPAERDQSKNRQAGRVGLIFNHFPVLSTLNYANYPTVNAYNRLLARVKKNAKFFQRVPNFIETDWVTTTGDAPRLVKTINDLVWTATDPLAALDALPPDP